MNRLLPACALAALLLAGCGYDKTVLVDTVNDTEIVAGLDYKDFEAAAAEATNAILASAKVRAATPAGKTYVVAVGKVVDATPMGIDTGLVTARIEEALLNDERFTISAVFADSPANRDDLVADVRTVRGNDGGHQYEYYFQMRLNDLRTGTTLMAKETKVIKRTGDKDHTW